MKIFKIKGKRFKSNEDYIVLSSRNCVVHDTREKKANISELILKFEEIVEGLMKGSKRYDTLTEEDRCILYFISENSEMEFDLEKKTLKFERIKIDNSTKELALVALANLR